MRKTFLFIAALAFLSSAKSQGTLEFNQVKIITNTVETVPSGKVWKITAMSGTVYGECVPHPEGNTSIWYKATAASGFLLNGNKVYSMLKYPSSGQRYNSNTCVTTGFCCDGNLTTNNQATDPLVLPMWLPAGTTLGSIASSVFLSVIEFNVVP